MLKKLNKSLPISGKQQTQIKNAPKAKYRGSGAKPPEATSTIAEGPFGPEHKQQKIRALKKIVKRLEKEQRPTEKSDRDRSENPF